MLALSLMVVGCLNDAKKTEDEKPLQLVQQEDKVFALDTLTNYAYLVGKLFQNDNKTTYAFYNEAHSSIYVYDYESGDLENVIKLKKEGPNGVPVIAMTYLIHSKDSIFINGHFAKDRLYIVNQKGEVIYKKPTDTINSDDSNLLIDSRFFEFDEASYFSYPLLHTNVAFLQPQMGKPFPLRVALNLTTNTLQDAYLDASMVIPKYEDYLVLSNEKRGDNLRTTTAGKGNHVFGSSQISDSIFEFNNGEFVKGYYASNPKITLGDYKAHYESVSFIPITIGERSGIQAKNSPNRPPYFERTLIDLEGEWIYRFLVEKTELEKVAGSGYMRNKVVEMSIVAFNTKTKKSYTFKYPEAVDLNVRLWHVFANKNGIHFPILDQESESEKRYHVYKIE